MIYFRMKILFWCCVLIMSMLTSANSQRHLQLIEKLERLLKDPAYNDADNEIHKPYQRRGMLLKGISDHDPFDTSSEERFFRKLSKSLEKISAHSEEEKPKMAIVATTTVAPSTIITEATDEETATITTSSTSEKRPSRSIASLGSIISRLIGLWRN